VREQGPSRRLKRGADRRFLDLNHGTWRVVVGLRVNGKIVKLQRSLGTSSLAEAKRLRWPVVAELKTVLHKGGQPHPIDDPETWRAALAAGDGGPDDQTPHALSDHLDTIRGDPIATEADHDGSPVYFYHPEREKRATEFADRAYGRATPLDTYLDPFLASRGKLREDTERRHRWAVKALADWLKAHGLPPTIEAVDGRVATRYVDDLPPGRRDPERLGLYWLWLVRREHATSNPWRDLRAAPRTRVEPERAWTDDEARRLLDGPASPSMRLLMEVGALTGARLNAIINMRVEGNKITFPAQKKELGPRTIPLHSHLRDSLAKCRDGQGFSGWPWPDGNRASQAFTAYRRSVLGPDEPGRRRGQTNFHSWRRWFISKAERAGIDERIISDVVGHARRSMTGRYSAGASMEQMRVCVEAVKLPETRATGV
jgi:hypothetical protein